MKKHVIAILFGGHSTEYLVSLQSAYAVLSAIDKTRYVPMCVGITQEGQWYYYTGPYSYLLDDTWWKNLQYLQPCLLSPDRSRHELIVFTPAQVRYAIDAVFPVLHGKNGEDGTVQGYIELAGIPLIGCGTFTSSLCMDKFRTHQMAALAGIPVPKGRVVTADASRKHCLSIAMELGFPLFVKPVRAGSSWGITKVSRPEELEAAIDTALEHDREVLLEEEISGTEIGCAVMGNQTLRVGELDEILLSGGFFNYTEKYTLKTSQIICPARISPEKSAQIQTAAKQIYRVLGCRGFARIDFFLTKSGQVFLNEVNTIPGFTSHSRFPTMMEKSGLSFPQLIHDVIELGLAT